MDWKEGFTMKIYELSGLATFHQPHGWQIKKDEWDKFLQQFELSQFIGVPNLSKAAGKHHYFRRIGGGSIHNQPYLQYNKKQLAMLQTPRHSFRRARQALHDVVGEFPVLAN
jgi:hypothetical protein